MGVKCGRDSGLKSVACLISAEMSIEMNGASCGDTQDSPRRAGGGGTPVGGVAGVVTLAAPADAAQTASASAASAGSEAAGTNAGAASAGDVGVTATECWAPPGGEWPWTC